LINKNKENNILMDLNIIHTENFIIKSIKFCETIVEMNYPKSGKHSKIIPVIDWYPIIWGYLESIFDKVKFEK
tara:strand:- start:238 stop:456 length:219 start_codon:yes stop_codon:yes gene_type:complete